MELCFVEFRASDRELEIWRRQFPIHGEPYVKDFSVPTSEGSTKQVCGICSRDFDALEDDRDVLDKAEDLFLEMRGWTIVESGGKTSNSDGGIGGVFRLSDDGVYRGHNIIRAKTVHIVLSTPQLSGVGVVIGRDGKVKSDKPCPTAGQKTVMSSDTDLKAALRYIALTKDEDWNQLYRALDAIGKVEGLQAGGISRKKAVRVLQTANLHRKHNPIPQDGPPLRFHEARALILTAIRQLCSANV